MRREIWFTLGICAGLLAVERSIRSAFSGDRSRPSGSAHTYVLERTQIIPAPVEQVFPFFEKPENLGAITPPWMGFEIVRLESLVEYESGHRFVDLQTQGPYR